MKPPGRRWEPPETHTYQPAPGDPGRCSHCGTPQHNARHSQRPTCGWSCPHTNELVQWRARITQLEEAVIAAALLVAGHAPADQIEHMSENLHSLAVELATTVPRLAGTYPGGERHA